MVMKLLKPSVSVSRMVEHVRRGSWAAANPLLFMNKTLAVDGHRDQTEETRGVFKSLHV